MSDTLEEKLSGWDDPISAPDSLDRADYAARVAEALQTWKSPESLVTAIYGPWGSGKTWLLGRIESEVQSRGKFSICRFAPWQYQSNEQITAEFFAAILRVLEVEDKGKQAGERARLWRKLGKVVTLGQVGVSVAATLAELPPEIAASVGALPTLFKAGEDEAAQASDSLGLPELRDHLMELFSSEDAQGVLVTIDDLDRLEDEQIRMILRLVKTTANFPNLNYLILGERRQIASALDSISSNQGDRYLEKIVQIPLTLPQASSHQLRGRLWEGLEIIAKLHGYDLESRIERFESFWREFLCKSLNNHRAVHRLLTTLSFHARCLSREGAMEVDLLDLLGIDFMRCFAPKTYERIAADPLSQIWMMENRPYSLDRNEKVDSEGALALIEESEIGPDAAFHLLAHLFPDFYSMLPVTTQSRRFYGNDHQKHKLSPADLPIWHDSTQPLYFQLTPQGGFLPTTRYREFLALETALQMIQRFEEWETKGWRKQLINRLNDDPNFFDSESDPREFLLALSSISDDLETDGSILDAELDMAKRLWSKRFSKVPEEQRMKLIENLIDESRGVSILLLVIEELRGRNGAAFNKKSRADESIPTATTDEIERLTEKFFPQIRNRFLRRTFPVARDQAWRLYRLAHAIGPVRLEEILRVEFANDDLDATWAIAEAVIIGLVPQLSLDLTKVDSVGRLASKNVAKSLLQFASSEFWVEFAESARELDSFKDFQTVALLHIEVGFESLKEERVDDQDQEPGS